MATCRRSTSRARTAPRSSLRECDDLAGAHCPGRRPSFQKNSKEAVNMRKLIAAAAVLVLASSATPSLADTSVTPPGNPCTLNNGNPCNGNNGNLGRQGNARDDFTRTDRHPPAFDIPMPAVTDRNVFISQVGNSNQASVNQTAPNAYARVDQNGNSNDADVGQSGTGKGYLQAI